MNNIHQLTLRLCFRSESSINLDTYKAEIHRLVLKAFNLRGEHPISIFQPNSRKYINIYFLISFSRDILKLFYVLNIPFYSFRMLL